MPSGDSGKIIRGSEFETEFDNISTAIATKADAADPTFTGTVTIDGLTVNGNTTLGNAATDTVTVTADIASNLIPSADDTYNLGASGAEWNDLFVDGTANIDSLVADTADINGGTIDGVTIGGSSAGAITGTAISGTSFASTGNMTFGDNDKAIFGAGSDLQIYHDGTDSLVRNSTGNLIIQDDNGSVLLRPKSGQSGLNLIADGTAALFYAGVQKLNTTSTGVDVTGTVIADALTVDGQSSLNDITTITSTNPRLRFIESDTTDVNTDIRNSGGDFQIGTINDAVNSVKPRFNIDHATGDISFYEDTGTTAKLFWDASAESLGIGTSSPETALHLYSTGNTIARITSGTSSIAGLDLGDTAGTDVGRIRYDNSNNSLAFTVATNEAMRIDSSGNVGIGTDSPARPLTVNGLIGSRNSTTGFGASDGFDIGVGGSDAYLVQRENANIIIETNGAERMRIDSSGNVLVGKTSADVDTAGTCLRGSISSIFTVDGSVDTQVAIFNRKTNDGTILDFRKNGSTVGSVGNYFGYMYLGTGDTGLLFDDDNNHIKAWNTSTNGGIDAAVDLGASGIRFKDLYLSGGAYLGGTAAANKLDDYEEGTFTPVIQGSSTAGTGTYSDQYGSYTKVGNAVTFTARVVWSAHTGTGNMLVAGLPFNSSSATDYRASFSVYHSNISMSTSHTMQAIHIANVSSIQIREVDVGGGADAGLAIDSSGTIIITGVYFTA